MLVLTVRNASLSEDPFFIPVAIMMILGYATVGAVLASRNPRNPIGWLLMAVGTLFLLTGLSDEYMQFVYSGGRGGEPLGPVVGLITSVLWLPMLGTVSLLILLFPTGAVPGPRWRPLAWSIVGAIAVYLIGSTLAPGPLEELGLDVVIENPFGIEGLGSVARAATGASETVAILGILPSLAGLVVRYRRSRGEERQQLRWLAYVIGTLVALVLLQIAAFAISDAYVEGTVLESVLFLASFALAGIGIPAAMGVAVLRYRLYDLDIVVKKTVVFGTLVVLVMGASLFILLALSSPFTDLFADETQAVGIAMFVVGLSVWPLWRLARRIADRIVYGGRATPYEVLSEFSERVGETYSTDDVLPRMAQLLGEATGARVARVWLRVGDRFRPAASWPADATAAETVRASADAVPDLGSALGEHAVEVRHQGELLGALSIRTPASDPMNPSKERIVLDLAAQAGLVLRNVRLIEELRASRRRIVAAQDDRAKKLERDIHDGAQQQLVALSVKARLAGTFATRAPERTQAILDELQGDLADAIENLRDLARGVYPPLLADQGLAAALTAQARKVPTPVRIEPDGVGRFAPDVEATVYFCVLEALQNVAKYAEATMTTVRLGTTEHELRFEVTDDGRGFDPTTAEHGTGLQGIEDRLSALGGNVEIISAAGRGTTILGRVPT